MKLKNKGWFAIGIALVVIMGVFACTPPAIDDTIGDNTNSTNTNITPRPLDVGTNNVYVAITGNDTNDGLTPATPFLTIQKAIDIAKTNTNRAVLIGKGIYTAGSGLSTNGTNGVDLSGLTNVRIYGGCNNDYTMLVGYSELDGNNSIYHIISMSSSKSILIDGFVIRGGNANGTYPNYFGGGVNIMLLKDSTITNCIISNNFATMACGINTMGISNSSIFANIVNNHGTSLGAILLYASDDNLFKGIVSNNSGGGICIWTDYAYSYRNTIDATVANNIGIGVHLGRGALDNTITGTINNNTAESGAGILINPSAANNTITAIIINNIATNEGGGIYASTGPNYNDWSGATVSGNISINTEFDNIYSGLTNIYVSTTGDDVNDGSKTSPFKSIQKAIDVGNPLNLTVNVASGVYTPGDGLNPSNSGVEIVSASNLRLLGGWDNGFTTRSGYSELDGNNSLYHILYLYGKDYTIDGFVIREGNADGDTMMGPNNQGGGIYASIYNSTISNCIISNNFATNAGAGIYFNANTSNNIINALICNNSVYYYGGGIYSHNVYNYTFDGFIYDNTASSYGGGCSISGENNTMNATIYNNISSNGGGISISGENNTISGSIYDNTATNGGGMFISWGSGNIISSSIYNNNAMFGGGIYLDYGVSNNTFNGSILSNTANKNGGGIFSGYGASINTFDGSIQYNASSNGGGIYLYYGSDYNIFSGIINNNIATNGGGVYLDYANNNCTFSGSVCGNTAISYAGGIYLQGTNCSIGGTIANNIGGGISFGWGSINNTISASILSNIANTGNKGGGVYFNFEATNNTFTATSIVRWNTVTGGSIGDGGGVYNNNGAGTQITNTGFTISNNSPDDWAGGVPSP